MDEREKEERGGEGEGGWSEGGTGKGDITRKEGEKNIEQKEKGRRGV